MTNAQALNELGLTGTPAAAEIKSAYRARSKQTHPDAGGSDVAFAATQEAYATLTGAKPATAPKAAPRAVASYRTREEWLVAGADAISAEVAKAGVVLPEIKLSVGYGRGGKRQKWSVIAAAETTNNIAQAFISPEHDLPADALADVSQCLCDIVDLAADPMAKQVVEFVYGAAGAAILAGLGVYPHAAVSEKMKKTAGTRMLKAECPGCGCRIWITKKWAQAGMPKCGAGCKNKTFTLV